MSYFASKKRKAFGLALCAALFCAPALTGCGGQQNQTDAVTTPEPLAQKEFVQGLSVEGVDLYGLTYEQAYQFFYDEDTAPRLPKLQFTNGELSAELDGSVVKGVSNLGEILAEAASYGDGKPVPEGGRNFELEYTFDISPLRAEIERVAQELSYPAVDASAKFNKDVEGFFEYVESVNGRTVDADALYAQVAEQVAAGNLQTTMEVPYTEVASTVTSEMVKQNTQLISTCTSSFKKGSYSAANRVDNIEKACEMINGYELKPGEIFSFNDVLGPRKASLGWKSAGAINGGKSVQEVGGGVCQVSSTGFQLRAPGRPGDRGALSPQLAPLLFARCSGRHHQHGRSGFPLQKSEGYPGVYCGLGGPQRQEPDNLHLWRAPSEWRDH